VKLLLDAGHAPEEAPAKALATPGPRPPAPPWANR
jgi:hypothetical protein